jgi:hypothetical protein
LLLQSTFQQAIAIPLLLLPRLLLRLLVLLLLGTAPLRTM